MASDAIDAGVWYAFCCSIWFIANYTKIVPWWKNEVGLGMVSMSVALLLLILPQIVHLTTGLNLANTFFLWYYVASFFVSGTIELWRARTVHRIHKNGEQQKEKEDENLL